MFNRGNMGMNHYNQGYGQQMPFAGRHAMAQPYGGRPMQQPSRGGYPNNFGPQQNMGARGNFRLPPLINPAMQNQQGMNMMHGMQGRAGMNMMPGMQGQAGMNMMQGMQGQAGMNMAPGMQGVPGQQGMPGQVGVPQSAGDVTFEPHNPAMHQMTSPANPSATPLAANTNSQNPILTGTPSAGAQQSAGTHADTISTFIQGEKNAAIFYPELRGLANDEYARSVIGRIADNADKRRRFLNTVYNKMTGGNYTEKDLPIIKSESFSQGIRMAIEIENNTLREMSDLYDKIDNGMHLKSLNSVIQKKIMDIISLQQLAMYQ